MIKAVIFDMFETLVSLCKTEPYFGKDMAKDADIPLQDFGKKWHESEYERFTGKVTTEVVMTDVLKTFGKYSDELMSKIMEKRIAFKERAFEPKNMHPDIVPMLKALKENGLKTAVISNCYSEECAPIRNSLIYPLFDEILLSWEQGVIKPDHKIFEIAMDKLGVKAEECLYVGDGGSDELKAAKEVGMNPVQATWYLQDGLNQPTGPMQEFRQVKEPMDIVKICKGRKPSDFLRVEGEHIVLRKAKEDDYRSMLKHIWGNEKVYQWMLFKPTYTEKEAIERCHRSIEYQKDNFAYFVALKDTDEAIGLCAIRELEPGHFEESGIGVGSEFQGKGYGKEIVSLLLKLGFTELGAIDFRYGYFQDNIRSKKIAEYFGFKYDHTEEMTRPWDGSVKIIDSCLLTRQEYMNR